ncbi:hypothetical protein PHMEG_00030237 [Phytophthora megakarya]|uniref:Crinkler effector protein N-terminal domain-containing protein n=1 Tax=Phytophthora megakarya TaxID=4795 RepID=A0A225V1P5_9STRA|nr:hypothetical protein PHMEG_00030237 [Phytophthora megakarya]
MVKLVCVIDRVPGSSFPVDIDENKMVGDLKTAIQDAYKCNILKDVDPGELQLFLAKTEGGAWLTDDDDLDKMLQNRVDTSKMEKLRGSWELNKPHLFGPLGKDVVHVLVVVPDADGPPLKKRRVNISLKELWKYSALELTVCPEIKELAAHLSRPLPFQLSLTHAEATRGIFAEGSPKLNCEDLATMINTFVLMCGIPPAPDASENEWLVFYQMLLNIPIHLCKANALDLTTVRDRVGETSTTYLKLRPDVILHYNGLVLFRGEEKNAATKLDVSLDELVSKMRSWNPMFYGELPYILGYATSGPMLRLVAIDRYRNVHKLLDFRSITLGKAETIKAFFNLSFLLDKMSTLSNRMQPTRLKPFTATNNKKRTLELMEDKIRRTIEITECEDQANFDRLADIYLVLEQLGDSESERTHLQTVLKRKVTNTQLTVELGPVGFERQPKHEEICEWLRDILTALKYWHGCGYCHGDIRWRNMVYVPSEPGYWLLIDMDESHRPNTGTIYWHHPFHGHKLGFHHDLVQVGKLMEGYNPLDRLKNIQTALLEADQKPVLSAQTALDMLDSIDRKE